MTLLQHQQQFQNGGVFLYITAKTLEKLQRCLLINKEKENMLIWIFKFAHRKKVGMLFLCLVSIAAIYVMGTLSWQSLFQVPAVVAGAIRALFDRISELDMECWTRLILWFSHHLSNFQFIWP